MTEQAAAVRRHTKTLATLALALLAAALSPGAARAQWTTPDASNNIHSTNTGNVGVGTSAPSDSLHVTKAAANNSFPGIIVSDSSPMGADVGGGIAFRGKFDGSGGETTAGSIRAVKENSTSGDFSFGLSFNTRPNGSNGATEAMRILGGGNVGIGTRSPAYKLQVVSGNGQALLGDPTAAMFFHQIRPNAGKQGWLSFTEDQVADRWAVGIKNGDPRLYFTTTTGGTYTDRVVIDGAGNLGVGTASPATSLNIVGGGSGQSGAVRLDNGAVQTQLVSDATQAFGQVGTLSNHGLNIITNGNSKVFITAAGNVGVGVIPSSTTSYRLDVSGDTHVAGAITAGGAITGATVNATYQDVAEWVPSTQELPAGTVVVLDTARTNHVLASTKAYDTGVAGVVSDSPGVILGRGGEGRLKVATTGRVKVRAEATGAPIRVGDLLVTSGVEGVAMKSIPVDLGGTPIHRPGTIIGKALEPLDKGTGEILVLLSLQ